MPNPDRIRSDWRDHVDPERAVVEARQMVSEILDSRGYSSHTIELNLHRLEQLEVLLDAEGGQPMLVHSAASAVAKQIYQAETSAAERRLLTSSRILTWKVRVTKMRMRALHCAGRSDLAFRAGMAIYTILENSVGGHEPMREALGHRPNDTAKNIIEILGIMVASLRRTETAKASRDWWFDTFRELLAAYIPDFDATRAHPYPACDSLVQVLFGFAELGEARDYELIMALRKIDELARPTDLRGQATIAMREVAVARYLGDVQAAKRASDQARKNLKDYNLVRHLRRVDAEGLLEPADPERPGRDSQ